MLSLRFWLTSRYSLLILGSLAVFAFALAVVMRSAAFREAESLAQERARLTQVILRRTSTAGALITVREPRAAPLPEAEARRQVRLEPGVRELLNEVRGYVWVLADSILYESAAVRSLDSATVDAVNIELRNLRLRRETSARVRWRSGLLAAIGVSGAGMLVERQETLPNGQLLRVVAGVPLSDVSPPPAGLLATALVILPIILLLSVGGAHVISMQATEPLERITHDVLAITDGRSLHRRLHPEHSYAEFVQLTGQLNEMMGRLETSFAALRRFTADASHELKTPLAVLRADVERAMHSKRGGTEQMVALEEALQETRRMSDLVESLLTLARADEGRFDIVREPVDLEPLARDVFETALILGENTGLNVTMNRADPCVVEGDRIRLRQLFLNLITNAIKYTPRGGEVELSLTATDREATFTVRDTGIGIAAIDLPNIFDRFYRADRVRSRQSERGGFGLGLSIAQWIAHAHGGTLTAQSRLHRGSTFTVTLPLAGIRPHDEAEPAERAGSRAAPAD